MVVAAVMAAAIPFAGWAKKSDAERERDRRKADYIFMEAQKYQLLDQTDAYYELIDAAYQLNPDDPYIGKEYAVRLFFMPADSASIIENADEALALNRRYIDLHPDDSNSGMRYINLLATELSESADSSRSAFLTDELRNTLELVYNHASDRTVVGATYATFLANNGEIQKAIDVIRRVEDEEGGANANTTLRKMQYYLMDGDTTAVIAEGKALLRSNPASLEYNILMGNVYQQLLMPDSALMMFNRSIELDPTSGLAYYSRANYYMMQGDSAAYDNEVIRAVSLPDLDVEPKLEIFRDYLSKHYTDSLYAATIDSTFKSLIDQYPHEPGVRDFYAQYLTSQQQYAPAAEQLSYLLDMNPDHRDSWLMLSRLYYASGQQPQALDAVENGLRYFPDNIDLYKMGAGIALELDRPDEANGYLDRAMPYVGDADPETLSELLSTKGDVFYKTDQPDSAFVYYEKALVANPDNSMAKNNCAYHLAVSERDLDRALKLAEEAVAAEPENVTTLDTYAWVLFKLKEYAKAREVIDQVLELDTEGNSAEMLEHAGDIYFMTGDPEEALSFWQQALKLDPDNKLLRRKVKHKTFFFN